MKDGCVNLVTLRGSVVGRYRSSVGKCVGGDVYVHRKYMREVIPEVLLKRAVGNLPSGARYNAVVYNARTGVVRFDEAPDFDEAREPHAGRFVKVYPSGCCLEGSTESIWHHKWLWVKDGYKGFDVRESWEWSRLWLGRLDGPACGWAGVWKEQLRKAGLS
jgi:hypothetical protein